MKQAYREMAKILLTGMVMVSLLSFAAGSALLPELGKKMDLSGVEYADYQDFTQTKAICGRKPPEIIRKGSWRWDIGEEISISHVFAGVDEEGNAIDVEVADISDEGKNSRMEFYQREGNKLVISERGAYLLELRAVDREHRSTVKRFALLVGGGK